MSIFRNASRSYAVLLTLLIAGIAVIAALIQSAYDVPKYHPHFFIKLICLPITGLGCGTLVSLICLEHKRRTGEIMMMEGIAWPDDSLEVTMPDDRQVLDLSEGESRR
jgi:hypothetical protein